MCGWVGGWVGLLVYHCSSHLHRMPVVVRACEGGDVWVGVSLPSPPLPLQMTASGLGARYASLPTEKDCFDDSGWWHLLREGELLGAVPELKGMLQLLEFCDSVVKVRWMWSGGVAWSGWVYV